MSQKIVFATGNAGKMKEIREILADLLSHIDGFAHLFATLLAHMLFGHALSPAFMVTIQGLYTIAPYEV